MAKKSNRNLVILAHISDLHAGSQYFISNLMNRTMEELNQLSPSAVIATGDLTDEGLRQEYKTIRAFLDLLKCNNLVTVPGNHDSRNVGYLHFEELFGSRNSVLQVDGVTIVGVDSSEPDLDSGRVGREKYRWIIDTFENSGEFKVFALHHHLLPVPGTGRERNIIYDAGDLLEVLLRANVDLVLCGHKHVPHVWRLENLVVVNAGTACSLRLRGHNKPCYNVVEIGPENVRIYRKYPFGGQELTVEFSIMEKMYCKWKRVNSE
ncbi:MAG: metallophosphoesterase [Actinomycetota bacterium]|nr:metallophosphoesterase [Actinomycetota bacterium]